MTTLDPKALEALVAHIRACANGTDLLQDGAFQMSARRTIRKALNDAADALSALPAQPVAVCSVKTMKLSDGRADYYVSVMVGDREITPHMFRIRGRAEFEVETWKWLFGQGEKPDMRDRLDRTADPDQALHGDRS